MHYPVGYRRYRLAPQQDGRIFAFDMVQAGVVWSLTPTGGRDGQRALAVSGALHIQGGRLAGITAPAKSSGYEIEAVSGGIFRFRKVREPQWSFAASRAGVVPPSRLVILDLRDGGLLLVDGHGVRPLLVVALGSTDPGAKKPLLPEPDIMLADDFAP